jgi:hypothetical protein
MDTFDLGKTSFAETIFAVAAVTSDRKACRIEGLTSTTEVYLGVFPEVNLST